MRFTFKTYVAAAMLLLVANGHHSPRWLPPRIRSPRKDAVCPQDGEDGVLALCRP